MQEFLTNNTVNWNLMSLTGYRTLVILSALIESPKTNEEINEYLLNNQYIKEKFSNDTIRLYINSLREVGCKIVGANKSDDKKYKLISHPFDYDIPKSQLKAMAKLYKSISDKIDVKEIIEIETFLKKLSNIVKNEGTKETLKSISILKSININILKDLIVHCKNKNQIIFLYNSPKSGKKEIEIIADKLTFESNKIYLWGTNLTHREYSYFVVDRILKICSIKFLKIEEDFLPTTITYEIYNPDYTPEADEMITEKKPDKLIIQVTSKNEFSLIQRVLHMADQCRVTQPEEFKTKLVKKLRAMEKNYEKA
ncbi:MAG: hypothetical protein PHC64_06025 [Candidatus Gastranaerophilales bacterium]|nr:hypothetical protein [Candidatus Gastranaerophilales bacterium]